jgi:hypothetical protein
MDDDLEAAIEACLAANEALARDCRAGVAGSWGALAGKAVLLYRDRLGRRLTDAERRAVWALLWQRLRETGE